MAITLKEILSTDTISGSRTTINDNFKTLASVLSLYTNIISTDTKQIKDISKIEVFNGTKTDSQLSTIGFDTNSNIKTLANLYVGGVINNSTQILSGTSDNTTTLSVTKGNVYIGNGVSHLDLNGSLKFSKDMILKSAQLAPFKAALDSSYLNGSISNIETDIVTSEKIGLISSAGYTSKVVDFSDYNSVNPTGDIKRIKLLTEDSLEIGKIIYITIVTGVNFPDAPNSYFLLDKETILWSTELTKGIKFTAGYQTIGLLYVGGSLSTNRKWLPIFFNGCSIE